MPTCPICNESVSAPVAIEVTGRRYEVHDECYDAEHAKLVIRLKLHDAPPSPLPKPLLFGPEFQAIVSRYQEAKRHLHQDLIPPPEPLLTLAQAKRGVGPGWGRLIEEFYARVWQHADVVVTSVQRRWSTGLNARILVISYRLPHDERRDEWWMPPGPTRDRARIGLSPSERRLEHDLFWFSIDLRDRSKITCEKCGAPGVARGDVSARCEQHSTLHRKPVHLHAREFTMRESPGRRHLLLYRTACGLFVKGSKVTDDPFVFRDTPCPACRLARVTVTLADLTTPTPGLTPSDPREES